MPIKFVEPFCVSKEFWYRKFSSKGGGKHHGFVEKFFISPDRKTSLGNTSVYHKISGVEKFYASEGEREREREREKERERGGYHVSASKTFCNTVPKNFVREHFGVSENSVYRKILCIRRGYH